MIRSVLPLTGLAGRHNRAVLSRPVSAPRAESLLRGARLDDEAIAAAADAAYDVAKPMDNTDFDLLWRKKVVRSLVTHALRELRGDDVSSARMRYARQLL